MPDRLTVTAPASSANLGPGFDCLAVALELRNDVVLTARGDAGWWSTIEGEGAGEAPPARTTCSCARSRRPAAIRVGLDGADDQPVPFARGLGSSAATIVAGLVAGAAWSGAEEVDLLALATAARGASGQRRRGAQRRVDAGLAGR